SFKNLAIESSEDLGTKSKGGDLGYFKKGQMTAEFERVAFSLPTGSLSEPVKTEIGYHLTLVNDRRGGETAPLSELKEEIAKKLLIEDQLNEQKADLNKALASQDSAKVESLVKSWKLKWAKPQTTSLGQDYLAPIGE